MFCRNILLSTVEEYSALLLHASVAGIPRARRFRDFKNCFSKFVITRFTDKGQGDLSILCPQLYYMQETKLFDYPEISTLENSLAASTISNVIDSCINSRQLTGVTPKSLENHEFGASGRVGSGRGLKISGF